MNPETPAMLARLSEQELERLSIELAEIEREHARLHMRHLQAVDGLLNLHERLRAARSANLAEIALLHEAVEEQRALIARRQAELDRALQRRRALLARIREAKREQQTRQKLRDHLQRDAERRRAIDEQRRLDDLFAARLAHIGTGR